MSAYYSDDTREEYSDDNSMMSEAGQDIVERWDW